MKGHTTTHSGNKARLARIEGQVRAIGRIMINDAEYGIAITISHCVVESW